MIWRVLFILLLLLQPTPALGGLAEAHADLGAAAAGETTSCCSSGGAAQFESCCCGGTNICGCDHSPEPAPFAPARTVSTDQLLAALSAPVAIVAEPIRPALIHRPANAADRIPPPQTNRPFLCIWLT